VIEMEDVVLGNVRSLDKIPDNSGIIWYLISDAKGTVQAQSSGYTVGLGANPANPLGYYLSIPRVSAP